MNNVPFGTNVRCDAEAGAVCASRFSSAPAGPIGGRAACSNAGGMRSNAKKETKAGRCGI